MVAACRFFTPTRGTQAKRNDTGSYETAQRSRRPVERAKQRIAEVDARARCGANANQSRGGVFRQSAHRCRETERLQSETVFAAASAPPHSPGGGVFRVNSSSAHEDILLNHARC